MKSLNMTIQMKAIEQFFPVVLLIMLCKVVLTVGFVDRIILSTDPKEVLKCHHSSEIY